MQFKTLVALAAISGLAAAENSIGTPSVTSTCSFDDFHATASAQVAEVAACATAVGDITILGDNFVNIDLTGLKEIHGNLRINGTQQLVGVNAPTLQLVSGELLVGYATRLASVNFAELTTVGTLEYKALPLLHDTGFTSGISSADKLNFISTGLNSLAGINVDSLTKLAVINNLNLQTINLNLKSVSESLSITYNADEIEVSFLALTQANNLIFQKISALSLGNLTSINGSLSLEQNYLEDFKFPKLTTIGNSLSIQGNNKLTYFEFPVLQALGGALAIHKNNKLQSFSQFSKLTTVGGSVSLSGDFNNGSFPQLTRVAGDFNMTNTGDLSCDSFVNMNKKGEILGDQFYCEGASSTVSSSSSKSGNINGQSTKTGTATSSSTKSSSTATDSQKKNSNAAPLADFKVISLVTIFATLTALVL